MLKAKSRIKTFIPSKNDAIEAHPKHQLPKPKKIPHRKPVRDYIKMVGDPELA